MPFIKRSAFLTTSAAAVALFGAGSSGVLAEDFIVDTAVAVPNGDINNIIDGDDVITVTSLGSIDVSSRPDDDAIDAGGDNNIITNNGRLVTDGDRSAGVFVTDADALEGTHVRNNNSITTAGLEANGIELSSKYGLDGNMVTNGGAITTSGDNADGIALSSSGTNAPGSGYLQKNSVFTSGSIATTGSDANGIELSSKYGLDRNMVMNSGAITTSGDNADGITLSSSRGVVSYNSVVSSGLIATYGDYADGIEVIGRDGVAKNTLVSSGAITTSGDFANGIRLLSDYGDVDENDVINDGLITTSGLESDGVYVRGDGNDIINNGVIFAQGYQADGIEVGNNNIITNSGRVVSQQANAISMGDSGTLNFDARSFVGGQISFGEDTTVNITTGPSHSIYWTLDDPAEDDLAAGSPNIDGTWPWFYNPSTQVAATFDPSLLAAQNQNFADVTSLLSQTGLASLIARSGTMGASPLSLSTSGVAPDSDPAYAEPAVAPSQPGPSGGAWGTAFGGGMEYESDGVLLDRDSEYTGFALGYRWTQSADLTLSAMIGSVDGEVTSGGLYFPSFDAETETWFAGLFGRQSVGMTALDFGVSMGQQSFSYTRFVNDNLAPLGEAWVSGDTDVFFFNAELAVSQDIVMGNGLTIATLSGFRYAMARMGGYTETGGVTPGSNAEFGARTVNVLEGRMEVSATHEVGFGRLMGQLGYMARNTGGSDDADITLAGVSERIAVGDGDISAPYVGATMQFDIGTSGYFEVDGDYIFGNDGANGYAVRLSLGLEF